MKGFISMATVAISGFIISLASLFLSFVAIKLVPAERVVYQEVPVIIEEAEPLIVTPTPTLEATPSGVMKKVTPLVATPTGEVR